MTKIQEEDIIKELETNSELLETVQTAAKNRLNFSSPDIDEDGNVDFMKDAHFYSFVQDFKDIVTENSENNFDLVDFIGMADDFAFEMYQNM